MMEELIILNAEDREKLKGLFVGLIKESDPYKQFEWLWEMEEMLLTEEDRMDIAKAVRSDEPNHS